MTMNGSLGDGSTPLHKIINACDAAKLIMCRMKCVTVDSLGDHPLHIVQNATMAVVLIAGDGDVNADNGMGRSSLHWAKNEKVTKTLLAFGADANDRINGVGDTPLLFMCTDPDNVPGVD
ncbi:unnamed protein product [Ectocarpus sp. CCAP 1310/34]|nr:unnamed protein product [Ectocarpus sp. CCAP 1310/34]